MGQRAPLAIGLIGILVAAAIVWVARISPVVSVPARRSPAGAIPPRPLLPLPPVQELPTRTGRDGAEMVLIPAGPVTMGSPEGSEPPRRRLTLPSFFIDRHEVTNRLYKKFLQETGEMDRRPHVAIFFDDPALLEGPEQPVVGVSWDDAGEYCFWAGKRLPKEAEWEKAARGTDERPWPWGDEPEPLRANLEGEEDGFFYTAPVGSFEAGRSPFGIQDMIGNVSEWVDGWYDPEQSIRVHRGGSWSDSIRGSQAFHRFGAQASRREPTIGFRCAMDAG